MTEHQFTTIYSQLGMKRISDGEMNREDKAKISWRTRDLAPTWWDPSFDRTTTVWKERNGVWVFAKYEEGQYLRRDLEESILLPPRDRLIVDTYLEHVPARKAVVCCVNVRHGESLAELFRGSGV
jgi:hypothetical protein